MFILMSICQEVAVLKLKCYSDSRLVSHHSDELSILKEEMTPEVFQKLLVSLN